MRKDGGRGRVAKMSWKREVEKAQVKRIKEHIMIMDNVKVRTERIAQKRPFEAWKDFECILIFVIQNGYSRFIFMMELGCLKFL